MLYTISTPDWNQARRQSDIYLVSTDRGVASTRQLTFTKDKNETNPQLVAGRISFIAFLSDRDATGAAPAGGRRSAAAAVVAARVAAARAISSSSCASTAARRSASPTRAKASRISRSRKDGKSIVYTSGRSGDEQVYALPVAELWSGDVPQRDAAGRATRRASATGNGRPTASASTSSRRTASTATSARAPKSSSP